MLTKQQFYSQLKAQRNTCNKHLEIDERFNFETDGKKCQLIMHVSERNGWKIEMQLLNREYDNIREKYLAKDIYGTLMQFGITSDYKLWKFVEKYIKDNMEVKNNAN